MNMPLYPYSETSRSALVADAMIAVANRYPQRSVGLLPMLDTLALLLQRPLCFSFFRKGTTQPYECLRTTLGDPDLVGEFEAVIDGVEKTGRNLVPIPATELYLCAHNIKLKVRENRLKAEFPELEHIGLFKDLFEVLRGEESGLGMGVLKRIGKSLSEVEDMPQTGQGKVDWAERRRILSKTDRIQLVKLVRPIVNRVLAPVSDSPLLKELLGTSLPFLNMFCVLRSAMNSAPRNVHFSYDAQLLLSISQVEAISFTFGKSLPALLELPLGATARSIADSVFCSGVVDFSDEQTGQGRDISSDDPNSQDWERRRAEAQVYGAIAKDPNVFYVPVHVSGIPWLALFTISPRSERTATWAHNYAIYRSLVNEIAENTRTLAKSIYIDLVQEAFVDEYRRQDKGSFVQRVNNRWEQLPLVLPFPAAQARLTSPPQQNPERPIKLPDGRFLEIDSAPNPWFPKQIEYDVLDHASIRQACEDANADVGKEDRAAKLEWEAQEHTIFNCIPIKKLQLAMGSPLSELSGQARTLVQDAGKKVEIMEKALAIAFGRRHTTNLEGRVGKLLSWLQDHRLSTEPTAELTLPPEEGDLMLDKENLHNAFTVLWNLWQNASDAQAGSKQVSQSFRVKAGWDNGRFSVSFENEGRLGQKWVDYLMNPAAPSPNALTGMTGLMIVKTKMQALDWSFLRIDASEQGTRIVAVLGPKRARRD